MKKFTAILCALCLLLTAAVCPALAAEKTYLVGICQYAPHEALDAATQGFKDALSAKLGEQVKYLEINAAGEKPICDSAMNTFLAENVDLIMANATPVLQSAQSATADIPVLGTSITEYGVALDVDLAENGSTGVNISGTSDLAPLTEQAAMIKEWFPDAKTVGMFYCSAEANSAYQIKVVKEALIEMGYQCTEYAFGSITDVPSMIETACLNSDVIYIPTDNAAADSTGAIRNAVEANKVPVIAGEEGICSGCGVATLSISYYDIGYATGEMAYEILVNGADVSTMPVQYAPQVTKKYNAEICEVLGITPLEGYQAIEN